MKINIFRRINTGGEPLSPQELRHALNPGQATKFLDKLAQSQDFKTATNISKKRQQRMDDHEFILGFVAFYLTSYDNYPVKQGRDYFLNEAMIKINQMAQEELDDIENQFTTAMQAAHSIFGKYAFRKIFKNNRKMQPINKSLFEAWSVVLSKFKSEDLKRLKQHKNMVINKFTEYIDKDSEFVKSISQAADKVSYRFKTIEKIVQDSLT